MNETKDTRNKYFSEMPPGATVKLSGPQGQVSTVKLLKYAPPYAWVEYKTKPGITKRVPAQRLREMHK